MTEEDQNYKENKGANKETEVYLRKENHLAQQPTWLLNNTHFCYDIDLATNNDIKKNFMTKNN